jgi:putative aldouronate transport system permease protein
VTGKGRGARSAALKGIRENRGLYLLIAPAVILLGLFTYKPMYGVLIAFKDYRASLGVWNSPWVGLKHIKSFINTFMFGVTIKNTLLISVYSLAAGFPIPILLALGINQMRNGPFRKFFQVSIYLPYFISTVVLVGMLLLMISPSNGLLGIICRLVGIEAPNLMNQPETFIHLYVWSGIWQGAGWGSIVYLAALAAIDPELYEAATVDGATRLHKIRFIDIPLLMPTVTILLILSCGGLLGVGFEKIYLMQNARNLMNSEVISTYVYKRGLIDAQYSFSAAVGFFNTLVNFVILVTVNQIARKLGDHSLW